MSKGKLIRSLIWLTVVLLSLNAIDAVEEELDILIGHILSVDLAVEVECGSPASVGDGWSTWGVDHG